MKRIYIYLLVIILTIALVISEFIIDRDLANTSNYDDVDILNLDTNRYLEGIDENDITYNSADIPTTLTITNNQNDTETISYTYTLSINDISGVYRTEINGKEKYLIFDAQGIATITLKSNESIIIYGLPAENKYEISQNELKNYVTKVDNTTSYKTEGTLSFDGTHIIFFNIQKNIEQIKTPNSVNPTTIDTVKSSLLVLNCSFIICFLLRKSHVKKYQKN